MEKSQNKDVVAEEIGCGNNIRQIFFKAWKKSSPGWVGLKANLRNAYSNQIMENLCLNKKKYIKRLQSAQNFQDILS